MDADAIDLKFSDRFTDEGRWKKAGNLENHAFLLLCNLSICAIESAVLQGFFRPPSNH